MRCNHALKFRNIVTVLLRGCCSATKANCSKRMEYHPSSALASRLGASPRTMLVAVGCQEWEPFVYLPPHSCQWFRSSGRCCTPSLFLQALLKYRTHELNKEQDVLGNNENNENHNALEFTGLIRTGTYLGAGSHCVLKPCYRLDSRHIYFIEQYIDQSWSADLVIEGARQFCAHRSHFLEVENNVPSIFASQLRSR